MNKRIFSFHKISDCIVETNNNNDNKLYLTFDIDWACDDVLSEVIELIDNAKVAATWFVTHKTPMLDRLRDNPLFELGIHPNFNFLLNAGSADKMSMEKVIDDLLELVPEATSIRSHSLTQNSQLQEIFKRKGLTHECNHLIPEQAQIELKPWVLWNGLIKVPHYWEDDAVCLYKENASIPDLLERKGLKVFDFHPIHVFLNTELLDRYESTRAYHRDVSLLAKHRYQGYGTRSKLFEILDARYEH